ncbi:MAG: glycosyltransferase [Planctomycetes bacterium]|nr:glycosyltransferase [Planctomycetota bacterium]MBL7037650.1 glycosyltransferase [Pirellulaceae bacterium]
MCATVSVVTATYNYARFLPDALDSVLGQTFTDWEALVIDDGSTDNTEEVIQPYLNDPRIRYHRTENRGQPAAENTGIRLSQGKFIAFLDADDAWLPQKLERQLPLFSGRPELGVVFSRRQNIDPHGRPLANDEFPPFRGKVFEQMFRQNFVCFSSSVVRREVFESIGFFNEECRHASDYELWQRVTPHYDFDYVDQRLVKYRTGHANLTSHVDNQLLTVLKMTDRFVKEHGDKLPRPLIRQCYAVMYSQLGATSRDRSRIAALPWYVRALAMSPGHADAWRGLASLFLPEAVRRCLRRALGRPADWRAVKPIEDTTLLGIQDGAGQ